MIKTQRLILSVASDEEMKQLILEEKSEEMKQAYTEMWDGCKMHPEQRIWYAVWFLKLADESEKTIGDMSFKGITSDGIVEIGYGIHPEYQGKGYATEAVVALVHWALSQPGVTRVDAEADPDNIASQRVLAKAGFVANGEIGAEGPRFSWNHR